MGHTVRFTTMLLAECVELTKEFDQACFPEEMWLDDDAWSLLLESRAEATIMSLNNRIIGQAITLPEVLVAKPLSEADAQFEPAPNGVYSYSEAILPEFQNQGYGSLLMREIIVRMRTRGHTRITAHVRTRYGWHIKRSRALSVTSKRLVFDFWEDVHDQKVEFQTVLL